MNIETMHHFPKICYEPDKLKVQTLPLWMSRVNDQASNDLNKFKPEKYKGYAFEHLMEVLIRTSPVDKRINMTDYEPTIDDEKGVDGFGKTHSGETHTAQMKFRTDTTEMITETKDNIAMFPAFSENKYQAKHMTLFTTCKGLHYSLNDFEGKVRTLNYKQLRKMLDNNNSFWNIYSKNLDQYRRN